MSTYHIRPATLDDADALVHHCLGMFSDMGLSVHGVSRHGIAHDVSGFEVASQPVGGTRC